MSTTSEIVESFGGLGNNLAHTLRALGLDVTFVTILDPMSAGSECLAELRRASIAFIAHQASEGMGRFWAEIGRDGEPISMSAQPPNWTCAQFDVLEQLQPALSTAHVVFIELGLPTAIVSAALDSAERHDIKRCGLPTRRRRVAEQAAYLGRLDYIALNKTEAAAMVGVDADSFSMEDLATMLRSCGVANVLVTAGRDGCYALGYDRPGEWFAAPDVEVVDSTGAGDALAAAAVGFHMLGRGSETIDAALSATADVLTTTNSHILRATSHTPKESILDCSTTFSSATLTGQSLVKSSNQLLLIDGDDTLWANNIYFERATDRFLSALATIEIKADYARRHLAAVQRRDCQINGYGSASYATNLLTCCQDLLGRVPDSIRELATALSTELYEHPIELFPGVWDTLSYLAQRHRLALVTKGQTEEQQRKVEFSRVKPFFGSVTILKEKSPASLRRLADESGRRRRDIWMIGDSPRSDVDAALETGLNAVLVLNSMTPSFEVGDSRADYPRPRPGRIYLTLSTFADLRKYF